VRLTRRASSHPEPSAADEEPELAEPPQASQERQARRRAPRSQGQDLATNGDPDALSSNETVYGWVVALELALVAVLNVTDTHGKGAPAHPQTTLSAIGVAAAVAFFGLLRLKKRSLISFGAILAAFFVTLPPVPTSLGLYHLFAIVIAAAYGIVLISRRRRAERQSGGRTTRAASRRSSAGIANSSGVRARPSARRSSARKQSGRYTPPKPRRRAPRAQG